MIFLLIHIVLCLVYRFFMARKGKRSQNAFPSIIIYILPVFGFLMYLAELYIIDAQRVSNKKIDIEKLKVTDEKYRRLVTDTSKNNDNMVPLEDAFAINDSKLRRSLLLDILHKNPEEYLNVLERARGSEDVEVTHYATTTLLEIQSDFEQRLQEYKKQYEAGQKDREFLLEYSDCLKQYVDSGLIDGTVLTMQQESLLHIVEELMKNENTNRGDAFLYIETALDLREYDKAKAVIDNTKQDNITNEAWNQLAVRYYWETGQTEEIDNTLQGIVDRRMYLSKKGKEWFTFWSKGKSYEKILSE